MLVNTALQIALQIGVDGKKKARDLIQAALHYVPTLYTISGTDEHLVMLLRNAERVATRVELRWHSLNVAFAVHHDEPIGGRTIVD